MADNKTEKKEEKTQLMVEIPFKLAENIQLYLQTKPIQECIDLFSALCLEC